VVGDPEFDAMADIYDRVDDRFFRLRHYARVFQFVGLSKSAFLLNRYALAHFGGATDEEMKMRAEVQADNDLEEETLQIETFQNEGYFGRWFAGIAPEGSRRYREDRYGRQLVDRFDQGLPRRVFQGIREDIYHAGHSDEPFSHQLLSREDIEASLIKIGRNASIFSDGSVQIFSAGRRE
jgi:hypothetical protein